MLRWVREQVINRTDNFDTKPFFMHILPCFITIIVSLSTHLFLKCLIFPTQDCQSLPSRMIDFLSSISVAYHFLFSWTGWWPYCAVVFVCLKLVAFIELVTLPSFHGELSQFFQLPRRFPTPDIYKSWHTAHTDCSIRIFRNDVSSEQREPTILWNSELFALLDGRYFMI